MDKGHVHKQGEGVYPQSATNMKYIKNSFKYVYVYIFWCKIVLQLYSIRVPDDIFK